MLRCSRVFGLLRCDWETNAEQSERENERTPQHAGNQNQIAVNASKNFRKVVGKKLHGYIGVLSL
jgi:hypothetical protein